MIPEETAWAIARKIMADRGWKKKDNPLEFELDREDSQIVLIKEDIVDILSYLDREGYTLYRDTRKKKQ